MLMTWHLIPRDTEKGKIESEGANDKHGQIGITRSQRDSITYHCSCTAFFPSVPGHAEFNALGIDYLIL